MIVTLDPKSKVNTFPVFGARQYKVCHHLGDLEGLLTLRYEQHLIRPVGSYLGSAAAINLLNAFLNFQLIGLKSLLLISD
jgi:hypothetical protein